MKLFRRLCLLLLLSITVGYFALRYMNIRQYANHAPVALDVGRHIVYDPGCSILWCSGGALYKLDSNVADEILANGINWFNSKTNIRKSKKGRQIGSWEYVAPNDPRVSTNNFYEFYPGFYQKGNHHTHNFRKAVKNGNFYLSNQYSQPIIIVIPDERLVYIGWND